MIVVRGYDVDIARDDGGRMREVKAEEQGEGVWYLTHVLCLCKYTSSPIRRISTSRRNGIACFFQPSFLLRPLNSESIYKMKRFLSPLT